MKTYDNKKIQMFSTIGSRATFGIVAYDLANDVENLMVLTADVSTSAGLDRYRKKYSEKYLDVGIAEQNMIGIAAGLSSEGFNVITTTFAPFQTMRCLEQIKVNLGYMKNKVIMVGLASGIVLGSLGYTHCSIEDLSIMRSIPNITVISPADCLETAKSIESAINHEQSVYIRLTGSSNSPCVYKEDYDFKIGKVVNILNGEDVVILATGTMVYNSIEAANILKNYKIFPSIINVHTLNQIDKNEIKKITNNAKIVFTLEEHSIVGGLSSFYSELRSSEDITSRHISIALPKNYNISGEYEFLKELNLLTPEKIANRIKNELR